MNPTTVEKIFLKHNLGTVNSIKKIEIGFTNKIYLINDKFILKVCKNRGNEDNFEKEVLFYRFFKDKIPVPKVIVYDNSKEIYNRDYMIYPKIEGDNLYSRWHLMSNSQRREIIKQLCVILKVINNSPYSKFVKRFKINPSINWHDKIVRKINRSLKTIETKKILTVNVIQTIKIFVKENHHVLKQQKITLVYWDAHFDNILVKNNKIIGILDFERTELASLDFVLDIVKRMKEYPKKYISKKFERFAKKEDYANLLVWFQEFYPELFNFEQVDKRLQLYSIKHDLEQLLRWPNSKETKKIIARTVNHNKPS